MSYPASVTLPGSDFVLTKQQTSSKNGKASQPVSEVWNHFRMDEGGLKYCLKCATQGNVKLEDIACFGKVTSSSNLKDHLKKVHQMEMKKNTNKCISKKEEETDRRQTPIDKMVFDI